MRLLPLILLSLTFAVAGCATSPPAALSELSVAPERITVTGYSRDNFGSGWGSDGACTVREAILTQWYGPGDEPCTAADVSIQDPYTGDPLQVSETDIDHIYPLAAAWDFGAYGWDVGKRIQFANDPVNLIPVDAGINRAKSDLTPAEWLPDNACDYSTRYAAVALEYQLPVSVGDWEAMHDSC
ncbi:HNH endonuclease family protein [Corynebacterium sputi]|uniref:HNH endonuclease family protein n=1 Tax=Corynebacterium sputi TaxID=489915 RepID=UPI000418B13D|nr:HNH endonuclease family protein [Corynebacterium sputi]